MPFSSLETITVLETPAESVDLDIGKIDSPIRLGTIIDWIASELDNESRTTPDEIAFPSGTFYPKTRTFMRTDTRTPVSFSARESTLLLSLYRAEGKRLSRKDILQTIWRYAPGLETHTLETHIYRIRQKIENDPARPTLLLTTEDGYRLAR